MKNYDVTLTAHYEKTVSVCADSPEQAAEKVKIILFNTDLIEFSDEDFVCGEADITEHSEDGLDDTDVKNILPRTKIWRTAAVRTVRTSAPCAENVCMRTGAKNDMSYQALNLANQIRLLGGCP